MFRGVSELNLDSKGRIAVPTRYRELLNGRCGGHLVITIDTTESCLVIYPLPEWSELQPRLDSLSSIQPITARVKRQLLGNATDVDMDANGRLLIPTKLRKHANFKKRVVFIGQGKKFEIWDETIWDERNERWQEEAVLDSGQLPAELETLDI